MIKKILVMFIILFLLLNGMIVAIRNDDMNGKENVEGYKISKNLHFTENYEKREPIKILNNTDFKEKAKENNWSGNGTEDKPYIIEKYEIDGTDHDECIYISNTDVYFELKNNYFHSARSRGIYFDNVSNSVIEKTTLSNNGWGIRFTNTYSNIIKDNNISNNNWGGVYLYKSQSSIIDNTSILFNGEGIKLEEAEQVKLKNITMVENGIHLSGGELQFWNTHTIDTSNTIKGDPVYYWKDKDGGTIPSGAGQVLLANCNNVTVENQNLSDGGIGIQLAYSHNNFIGNNTVKNNMGKGIYLKKCNDNIFMNNNISTNQGEGIYLLDSQNNELIDNTFFDNNKQGIYLFSSDKNLIEDNLILNNDGFAGLQTEGASGENEIINNSITNNNLGIFVTHGGSSGDAVNNIITENKVYGNKDNGIRLWEVKDTLVKNNKISENSKVGLWLHGCGNNIIKNNLAERNDGVGISISQSNDHNVINNTILENNGAGISLHDESNYNTINYNIMENNHRGMHLSSTTYNNLIYHNLFLGNNKREADDEGSNDWSFGDPIEGGKGGNYWIDYEGGNRGDGIGDEPYNIERGSNEDKYPWMNPKLIRISISPSERQIVDAGEPLKFDVVAYNRNAELISNNTKDFEWFNATVGVFNKTRVGEYEVTAIYDNVSSVPTTVTVNPSDQVDHLEVLPKEENITVTKSVDYNAYLCDKYGNHIDEVTSDTEFSIEDGAGGEWGGNTYTSEKTGKWNITANYSLEKNSSKNLEDKAVLNVEQVDHININPVEKTVHSGMSVTYYAKACDEEGNVLENVTNKTDWKIEESAGGSWDNNVYYSEYPGKWTVTAGYSGAKSSNETATLTIKPSVDKVEIYPSENRTIIEGQELIFTAEAFGKYGDLITDNRKNFTWKNAEDGVFKQETASSYRTYEVKAIYGGVVSNSTFVKVNPLIKINEPTGGVEELTFNKNLTIEGKTRPGTQIWINEVGVEVDGQGEFTYETTLIKGQNMFEMYAEDPDGNTYQTEVYSLYLPDIPQLWNEIDNIQSQISNFWSEVDRLESDIENMSRDIEKLQSDLKNLENKIENWTSRIEDIEAKIVDLEDRIEQLEEENDTDQNNTKLKSIGLTTYEETDSEDGKIELLKLDQTEDQSPTGQIKELRTEIDELKLEKENLNSEIDEADSKVQILQKKLEQNQKISEQNDDDNVGIPTVMGIVLIIGIISIVILYINNNIELNKEKDNENNNLQNE